MRLESDRVKVNASQEEVFEFMKNPQNVCELLPEDKVSEWKADETSCSFKIQNAATISLVQKNLIPSEKIEMVSGEKSPFPFTLDVFIEKDGEQSVGYIIFDGKVNPFLKMMVEKPLSNLFNYMSKKIKDHFE